MAEFVGGATRGTATVSACFGSETLTNLTLLNLTLFEDDFATPADLLGCPDGRAVADRSCRVDCAGIGTTVTVVGFGFTFVTIYEFFNSSAGSSLRVVSMKAALSTWYTGKSLRPKEVLAPVVLAIRNGSLITRRLWSLNVVSRRDRRPLLSGGRMMYPLLASPLGVMKSHPRRANCPCDNRRNSCIPLTVCTAMGGSVAGRSFW